MPTRFLADGERLMTEAEVAELLGCSRRTVQRRPISYIKDGAARKYRRTDVEAYLLSRLVKPQAEQASSPPSDERAEEPTSSRVGTSRFGRRTVQLAADDLKEALALTARLRGAKRRRRRR